MTSSHLPAAPEPIVPDNGHGAPFAEPTHLRATLGDLRQLLDSCSGPTGGEAIEILGILRSIEILLLARRIRTLVPLAEPLAATEPTDSWLTPDEVAARLKRTRAWVYRQARSWPFAKRPSRKTLLISERGLARWMEHR